MTTDKTIDEMCFRIDDLESQIIKLEDRIASLELSRENLEDRMRTIELGYLSDD